MSDYKEAKVDGKQWQRCYCVHIDNPHGGQPMITFAEETVATLGEDTYQKPTTQITIPFDPSVVIELRNPQDGTTIGQKVTGMDIYVALYSLYIQEAQWRDTAIEKGTTVLEEAIHQDTEVKIASIAVDAAVSMPV